MDFFLFCKVYKIKPLNSAFLAISSRHGAAPAPTDSDRHTVNVGTGTAERSQEALYVHAVNLRCNQFNFLFLFQIPERIRYIDKHLLNLLLTTGYSRI